MNSVFFGIFDFSQDRCATSKIESRKAQDAIEPDLAEYLSHRSLQTVRGSIFSLLPGPLPGGWSFQGRLIPRDPYLEDGRPKGGSPNPCQRSVSEGPRRSPPNASWTYRDSIFGLAHLSCEKSKIPKNAIHEGGMSRPFLPLNRASSVLKGPF